MRATFATLVCTIAFGSLAADLWALDFFGPFITLPLSLLPFALVGSLLVVRRAGDPIGWLLGAAGALLQLASPLSVYAYASLEAGAALPGGEVVLWFLSSFIATTVFGLVVSALVRFPDGRPPGRVFAIASWVFVSVVMTSLVGGSLADRQMDLQRPFIGPHAGDPIRLFANPFALHGPIGDLMLLAGHAIFVFPALALIASAALVVRFRRSRGVEREQLKWLTYAAAITFGLLLIGFLGPSGAIADFAQGAAVVGIGLLPVAIGIAVTRYRLYDIDVLIRRTLIYATVTALLAAVYVGGVALFQIILSPFTSGSPIAIATSTLLVVALFHPLRKRIRSAMDRRFFRSKYDAERTLDEFNVRLRDEVDLGALETELLAAVRETVQPTHANVWLRSRAE